MLHVRRAAPPGPDVASELFYLVPLQTSQDV
jgi:hypothetical protein